MSTIMIAIDLSGRRGLVTGANSGLGSAIALNLAGADARVAVHVLNDRISANAVVKQIQQTGGEGGAVYGDVSQPPQVERLMAGC
jgi:NAD(P)-dependent dehydrogenase (short-subunit alcohol dehydrogenase family)